MLTKLNTSFNVLIFSGVSLISSCFISAALYILPLMVNSHYTLKSLLVTSFKFGLYRFSFTVANLILLGIWLYASLRFSFFLFFFFFSISAFVTYWLAEQKLAALQKEHDSAPKLAAPHVRIAK